ncbi:MAG: sensor histidine kinase, partial [Actinomycetota bacterium]
ALAGHPVTVDGQHVLADVDGGKVERIVENLLVNAGRHTPAGTPIHLGVERSRRGIVLVVEDEGPGVPDDLKEHVFDAFRQGEHANGGVGIGLSLVQRFAELHEGTARVEDRDGGGARFVVELPGEVRAPAPRAEAV